MTIPIPHETFLPVDHAPHASRRADGWSAASQRTFLEAIAEGHGVEVACARVGLSASSAYAFRRTAKGAAFQLGWRAANLLARDCVAETLLVRALEGQVETITHDNGRTITRHRHDNALAMRLLARLDRQVETAPDADVKAARLVAQEFDAFLGLVERDDGPARAGLFLARRTADLTAEETPAAHDLAPIYALAAADRLVRTGVATAAEVDIADLDLAQRACWTGAQWARAEAAGLLAFAPEPSIEPQHSQHSPVEPVYERIFGHDDGPVWWDDNADEWRTSFPPPEDFDGVFEYEPGHEAYERTLTAAERECVGPAPYMLTDAEWADLAIERDIWFAAQMEPIPDPSVDMLEPLQERDDGREEGQGQRDRAEGQCEGRQGGREEPAQELGGPG